MGHGHSCVVERVKTPHPVVLMELGPSWCDIVRPTMNNRKWQPGQAIYISMKFRRLIKTKTKCTGFQLKLEDQKEKISDAGPEARPVEKVVDGGAWRAGVPDGNCRSTVCSQPAAHRPGHQSWGKFTRKKRKINKFQ